jgi:haloalkane dehalogenase
MRIFHTPESCFIDLKDYPFKSHYIRIDDLTLHYLDEGPAEADPVLLLHGVPTWSYLYRNMIAKIAGAGNRVIVPDLIGFGKSDKPAGIRDHTFKLHIESINKLIDILSLKEIILFAQDWGSLIGLRVAAEQSERFAGLVICNGMLPTGEQKMHFTFKIWKILARYSPFLPVDRVIGSGMTRRLDKQEKRAYRAPFPSSRYMAGIRAMPNIVPVSFNDQESAANRRAWESLCKWDKPFLTVFSKNDPITRGGDEYMQKRIPGAKGQDHIKLGGGHFVQEEKGPELAEIIIKFKERIDSERLK